MENKIKASSIFRLSTSLLVDMLEFSVYFSLDYCYFGRKVWKELIYSNGNFLVEENTSKQSGRYFSFPKRKLKLEKSNWGYKVQWFCLESWEASESRWWLSPFNDHLLNVTLLMKESKISNSWPWLVYQFAFCHRVAWSLWKSSHWKKQPDREGVGWSLKG